MNSSYKYALLGLTAVLCVSLASSPVEAKGQNPQNQGDVDYNATPNSPTLPLVQYPPPQNYPTSVQIGTPSYYYYYPPMYGAGYGGGYGGGGYGPGGGGYGAGYGGGAPGTAGVSFYNAGGPTQRTFYYNTQIPGQIPYNGGANNGWGGGGFGGYNGYNGGLMVP